MSAPSRFSFEPKALALSLRIAGLRLTHAVISFGILLLAARLAAERWSVNLLLPSHGAMAVILLCLSDRDIARPRNVICGQVAGALLGIACRQWIAPWSLEGAILAAVAGTIFVITFLDCVYPPAGAVALWAVIVPAPFDPVAFLVWGAMAGPIIYLSVVRLMARLASRGDGWRRWTS